MIDKEYLELVAAYIEGNISTEDRTYLNDLIKKGEIDILDIKELEIIYRDLGKIPEVKPSKKMQDRFYAMLEDEKQHNNSLFSAAMERWVSELRARVNLRQLAFATAVFLVGMLIGNWTTPFQNYKQELRQLTGEVSQMREVMMLSLLDNESVTERLKAVNISTEMQPTPSDNKVAAALLKTLHNDPNVNVRLASIEALVHHASNPLVREGLVNAITNQQSPIIQAALADAMLLLQEKQSVDKFKKLLEQNSLDKDVRSKLQNTIAALS